MSAFDPSLVFSDETRQFRKPYLPKAGDSVRITIRTGTAGVNEVFLVTDQEECRMQKSAADALFAYYDAELRLSEETLRYFFRIVTDEGEHLYDRMGLQSELAERNRFLILPGFSVPAWAEGAVMYQIYVDRFRNGDPGNDVLTNEYFYLGAPVRKIEDWTKAPEAYDVGNFYGGDLAGVIDCLDMLKDLGVQVLYLNPLFVSPSNHKYDSQDYDHVDPHIGRILTDGGSLLAEGDTDNQNATRFIRRVTSAENLEASDRLLIELIEEAHARDMYVLLDGVFNHCGSFHKWMDREKIYEGQAGYAPGAYGSEDSPYHDYFQFQEARWPDNDSYVSWWEQPTLPKLNYEGSQELVNYILSVGQKWVSKPYCADGWRLDVAADLGFSEEFNHHFWQAFQKAVREANPNALILAEHYGDAAPYLNGKEWDTVMNYDAFMDPVSFFFTGMEKHSDASFPERIGNGRMLGDAMRYHGAAFPAPSLLCAMNELDNHDHSRFLTRTNHRVGRVGELGSLAASEEIDLTVMKMAVLFQMSWPGAPTIYYGDEAGLCGFTDPDSRRSYPWGNENTALRRFYKEAIRMHKDSTAMVRGSTCILWEGDGIFIFGRFDEQEKIIAAFHMADTDISYTVPIRQMGQIEGSLVCLLQTGDNEERLPITDGTAVFSLKKKSAIVYRFT